MLMKKKRNGRGSPPFYNQEADPFDVIKVVDPSKLTVKCGDSTRWISWLFLTWANQITIV
jgi:hypothetical protein